MAVDWEIRYAFIRCRSAAWEFSSQPCKSWISSSWDGWASARESIIGISLFLDSSSIWPTLIHCENILCEIPGRLRLLSLLQKAKTLLPPLFLFGNSEAAVTDELVSMKRSVWKGHPIIQISLRARSGVGLFSSDASPGIFEWTAFRPLNRVIAGQCSL